jgi:hypothetical protein
VTKFIPLAIVVLLAFTEPGQRLWQAGVDRMTQWAEGWAEDRIEEQQEREQLRSRLAQIEPRCGSDLKPAGFSVSERQAIALVVRDPTVSCDQLDVEPMGGGVDEDVTWAVHVSRKRPGGCELSAEVDGQTGEVSTRYRSCR